MSVYRTIGPLVLWCFVVGKYKPQPEKEVVLHSFGCAKQSGKMFQFIVYISFALLLHVFCLFLFHAFISFIYCSQKHSFVHRQ